MTDPTENNNDLLEMFTDTLRTLQDVTIGRVQHIQRGPKRDLPYQIEVEINLAGNRLLLLIVIRQTLYPREVQGLMWQLMAASHGKVIDAKHNNLAPQDVTEGNGSGASATKQRTDAPANEPSQPYPVPVLLAHSISTNARELLRQQDIGYFDSGGSLFITAPGAYVFFDYPAPKSLNLLGASPGKLFTDKRAEVIHALLMNHEHWLGVNDLAAITKASPATISQVLAALDRLGWLETHGQGPAKKRQLREPGALLDAWCKKLTNDKPLSLRRYYVPTQDLNNLIEHMAQVFEVNDVGYAVTHEVAAQRYTPYLTHLSQVRVRVTTGTKAENALSELNARVVSEGANLTIIDARSAAELRFRQLVDGVWLASPIQIYLDLMRSEGRAKELGQHFRKERIGF